MRRTVWLALAVVPVLGFSAASGLAQPEGQPQPGGQRRGFDPAQFVDRMMEQDANGDGKLSKEELGDRGEMMLQRADANSDGFLDRTELEQMMANRGQPGRGPGQAPGAPGEGAPGAAMTFDDGMQQSGRALRRLRRSEFNAQSQAGDLLAIEQIQAGLLAAKQHMDQVDMSEAAKAKFGDDTAGYHLAMRGALVNTLKNALDLELATASGNADKAKAALDQLVAGQQKSHELFQEEEEEGEGGRPGPRVRPVRPGGGG